jgi:hypothetical protein
MRVPSTWNSHTIEVPLQRTDCARIDRDRRADKFLLGKIGMGFEGLE